jgi:molybdopterin biosynthesis enzyme MoaB
LSDTRPREYAEEIGKELREWYKQKMETVPPEYRDMVADHIVNSVIKGFLRRKAK